LAQQKDGLSKPKIPTQGKHIIFHMDPSRDFPRPISEVHYESDDGIPLIKQDGSTIENSGGSKIRCFKQVLKVNPGHGERESLWKNKEKPWESPQHFMWKKHV